MSSLPVVPLSICPWLKGLYENTYGVGAIEISFFGKVSHWWSDQIAISRVRVW